ncbi:tRNA epoxyqueuosine(34) reductase QueG [Roseobacter sp.]|uniref:tRNA epoxyqueuosine(34) reductase QueG n=1 Tax=Roseobacter sp. TaxID=1907202 RepID=UPI00329726D5
MAELKERLIVQADIEGFVACRICRPDALPDLPARLQSFLDAGYHGQMSWMAERTHWRSNPATLWPDAQSVIMLAESYTPTHDPRAVFDRPDRGAISVYAQGRDYHDVVKKRLKRLARWLLAEADGPAEVKVFVDTAPVPEKALAAAAGLGWQGKHTNLVSRELGNWVFLGAIFTTLQLPVDAAEVDHCGSCRACLDVCPTDAFPAPYQLDARRCISYLTIEHKGSIPEDIRKRMGNHIYGCDDCLAACPWNKFAVAARDMRLTTRPELSEPPLAELAVLDDAEFRSLFSGSAVKRIGRDRFVRNVLYAIGNSGEAKLKPLAAGLVEDADPTVAEAARWAVGQLSMR